MSLVLIGAQSRSVQTTAFVFGVWCALALGPANARNHARAFCQLTTEKPLSGELCASTGVPARWKSACLSFSLTDPGPNLPPLEDMRKAADLSFGAWADVDCNGNPVGFQIAQTEQLSECLVPEYNTDAPNVNTVTFLADWSAFEMSSDTFGLTIVQLDSVTGEIYGADMVLLDELGPLTICGSTCPSNVVDVQNVMTHEAGHFYGLGHSSHPDATMSATAHTGDIDKRTLSNDDIAGICALYGDRTASCKKDDFIPRHGFATQCSPPPLTGDSRACALSTGTRPANRAGVLLVLAVASVLGLRRSARRRAATSGSAPRNA